MTNDLLHDPEQLARLREVLTTPTPGLGTVRILAIVLSMALILAVLWLVRNRRLREEYTPIWMSVAVALVVLTIRFDWLYWLTDRIGAWTPSSTLFFFGEIFLTAICLNYAVRLSTASVQIKNLAQEVALLRAELADARRSSNVDP